ncbi:MAG: hypothetical protein M3253_05490, partial [Chloroflexota bacterium]|nr:hypothetical protein [Chloroflexota bacterium]
MSFLPHSRRASILALAITIMGASAGCVGNHTVVPRAAADLASPVAWYGPDGAGETRVLGRWRQSVGPPVVVAHSQPASPVADRLIVVNWNVNVGAGNVPQLFMEVQQQVGPGVPIVLLLQEAYRSGGEVPAVLGQGATFASRILAARPDGQREEIRALASGLGVHAYYVPSMRNGSPLISDEDRGNAILSTMPLAELTAIELPFERQRRVAIGATVRGRTHDGDPWRLRIVSAHLEN